MAVHYSKNKYVVWLDGVEQSMREDASEARIRENASSAETGLTLPERTSSRRRSASAAHDARTSLSVSGSRLSTRRSAKSPSSPLRLLALKVALQQIHQVQIHLRGEMQHRQMPQLARLL